jgi:hypothetical protein
MSGGAGYRIRDAIEPTLEFAGRVVTTRSTVAIFGGAVLCTGAIVALRKERNPELDLVRHFLWGHENTIINIHTAQSVTATTIVQKRVMATG